VRSRAALYARDRRALRAGRGCYDAATVIVRLLVLATLAHAADPLAVQGPGQPRSAPQPDAEGAPKPAVKPVVKRVQAQPEDPASARARRAFAALKPAERKDVADFLASELEHVPTFQLSLARWVLAHQDRDPLVWPAETEANYYDPVRHAPAQPIPRQRLTEDDRRAVAVRTSLRIPPDPRAWTYDWATGSVLHRTTSDTPERALELALAGLPPELDLVTALVERALDDGSQRTAHAAFAQAYTDRTGLVYPRITLYDAWKSGGEIEMPDVDCLGIVHTVFDDWTTWTSIVPGDRQDSLYERIGEAFLAAKRQRELRVAIAATFVQPSPSMCCAYEVSRDNFHALWDVCASTPDVLAKKLPDAAGWEAYLKDWAAECTRTGELYQSGIRRRQTLATEGEAITATLMRVLDEYGAFAALREDADDKTKERPRSGR
jgi:hypothetical protein